MNEEPTQEDLERDSIFTRFGYAADRVEVRRILPNRKQKYLGRISRDIVEADFDVIGHRFGGGH